MIAHVFTAEIYILMKKKNTMEGIRKSINALRSLNRKQPQENSCIKKRSVQRGVRVLSTGTDALLWVLFCGD